MKNLFTIITFTIFLAENTNAQVLNPGFETLNYDGTIRNWGNVYMFSGYIDSLGVFHTDSLLLDDYFYFPTTDAHSGYSALELHNGYNVATGHGIVGAAGVDEDSVFMGWGLAENISVQNQPTDFSFYAKFFPAGGDTAIARLTIFDTLGYQLGEANIMITDSVDTYTYFTIPVTYWMPGTVAFISLNFSAFYTDGTANNEPHYGTRFLIDDVSIDNITGINMPDKNKSISITPNPATNYLNIFPETMKGNYHSEIIDANGKMVKRINGKSVIDISELPNGNYSLKVYDDISVRSTKFIKQ